MQFIDDTSNDSTDSYTLDFTYNANNVSDVNDRSASLLYKIIGFGSGLTDDTFDGRADGLTVAESLGSFFTTGNITPNGTELLSGFVDLSSANSLTGASSSVGFTVTSDFDYYAVVFADLGFDSDNTGEYLQLTSASISSAAIPEPSTAASSRSICGWLCAMRRHKQVFARSLF